MRTMRLVTPLLVSLTVSANGQEPFEGQTLISPMSSYSSFMIDMDLHVIKTWRGSNRVALMAYLLDDGSLLRPCYHSGGRFHGGGAGGRLQRIDADNHIVWDYYFSNNDHQQHHDVHSMPNGNVLLIAWELKTREEAIAAGRLNPSGDMWPTLIAEVEPVGPTGGNVVWEWHIWDHLIQDVDPGKENYGVIADHPELMDINYGSARHGDWIHANAIDYHRELDQIVFSSHTIHEFYVIDHSTTIEEAAGHTGGRSGMGGDILYRWGNPQVYDRGTPGDQRFFVVHGANWIDPCLPGEGNILVFNNGDRPGSQNDYSSVEEIVPPVDEHGHYHIEPGEPFGPSEPLWIYDDPGVFYSNHLSGAYRLPNGNTIISEGTRGHVFEVTEAGVNVWDYRTSQIARAPRYWTGSPACNGDEKIGKAKCKTKGGVVNRAIIVLKKGTPGQDYTCTLDTEESLRATTKKSGKAKFKFKGDDAPPVNTNRGVRTPTSNLSSQHRIG